MFIKCCRGSKVSVLNLTVLIIISSNLITSGISNENGKFTTEKRGIRKEGVSIKGIIAKV